ncbi:MAG TPA: amino acid aminotransferase [Povalibacter sp.]|nr:amino acid aminotransferase [Povalibacter sp.]
MFERFDLLPPDPILGLLAAFREDASPQKVDLGVGVYKDEQGNTPVLEAVRLAEGQLLQEQQTKTYLGPAGNDQFNAAIGKLVLGAEHPALRDARVRTTQAPGGSGALRLGAELLAAARSGTVHVSDPTWANHIPLLGSAGLKLERYPYYDARHGTVNFDAMLATLEKLPAGDIVLLHGACHNPTGADLSFEQWQAVTKVLQERSLVPFIDLAYQGLGDGLDEDARGARLVASSVPDALIAVSCSKNFGLYRERVGALIVVGQHSSHADAAASHLRRIARGLYSMPPDHGAAVVARILGDAKLDAMWRKELTQMRERVGELRAALTQALAKTCPSRDFSAIARQRGMFSLLDLPRGAAERLRAEHHIYIVTDGRTNVAGLSSGSIDYVAERIGVVLGSM